MPPIWLEPRRRIGAAMRTLRVLRLQLQELQPILEQPRERALGPALAPTLEPALEQARRERKLSCCAHSV
jgi:hypothetical protein